MNQEPSFQPAKTQSGRQELKAGNLIKIHTCIDSLRILRANLSTSMLKFTGFIFGSIESLTSDL